jgi:hypothetical protein
MLPLLSHALDQAWRHRAGQAVTLADYERTGSIEGAVAASAQRAYDALTAAQQAAARQIFLQLTATSAEGVDYADRATKAELTAGKSSAEAQDVEAVLEAFAAERLLTLAAGTVELSHEALLTAWPLLRDTWLADTTPTGSSAPGCTPPPPTGPATPATGPTSTAAPCWPPPAKPPPGSAPIPPATRRSARPNVTSCTPAAKSTAGPSAGGGQ